MSLSRREFLIRTGATGVTVGLAGSLDVLFTSLPAAGARGPTQGYGDLVPDPDGVLDLPRGFRVPGYPVTPILSVIACGYVLTGLHWYTYVWFLLWLSVVLAFYLLWGRRHSRLNTLLAADGTLLEGAGTVAGEDDPYDAKLDPADAPGAGDGRDAR